MDQKALMALGFQIVGGQIDRDNKNYGFLGPNGEPVLTPEGQEIVDEASKKSRKKAVAEATASKPTAEQVLRDLETPLDD